MVGDGDGMLDRLGLREHAKHVMSIVWIGRGRRSGSGR